MEAAYRRTAANSQSKAKDADGSKLRLVQLLISLMLFVLVFFGRGAFPDLLKNWSNLIAVDIDLIEIVQNFTGEIKRETNMLEAFSSMALALFGGEPHKEPPREETDVSNQISPPLILLSQTSQHGLQYLRGNGMREYAVGANQELENDLPALPSAEPEIVTAVAQMYNEQGEKLPRNVSYQYYEFGLEKTVTPVMGAITSGFEYRTNPLSGKREFHLALDIAAEEGAEIAAFADGRVRYIGESDEFGLYLMIDHDNGVATFYAHCSKLLVKKGEDVNCGQTVALVGHTGNTTGPHLHFTIEKDNIRLDPSYYVSPS